MRCTTQFGQLSKFAVINIGNHSILVTDYFIPELTNCQNEKFYVAARYNTISGKQLESATDNLEISRLNFAGGWYLSKNILTKVEYLKQSYDGKGWTGRFAGAEFSGVMVEAVISF